MRHVLTIALATAAMGFASPAFAAVELNTLNGHLATHIVADEGDSNLKNVVHGTDGVTPKDVSYDGDVDISITSGGGFAEIDPGKDVTNFTQLIIDPLYNFSKYEFSIQTLAVSMVSVYYMEAGGDGLFHLITGGLVSNPFSQDANGNVNYVVSSTNPLTQLKIVTDGVGLKFVKQNAIELADVRAVPEPATWAMMLLGFGGIGMSMRRKQRRNGALMQVA